MPTEGPIAVIKDNLERVLDNLKDGIIAHDMQRQIFFINREAERITGFKRDELLGRDCHDALGAPLCGNRCSFCDESAQPKEHSEYQINFAAKDGILKKIEMSVTLMVDKKGNPIGVLASLKDVTDLLALQIKSGELTSFGNIIGQDPKMLKIFQQIRDVAGYDYPVHVYGGTGTGKELVANAIHNESFRSGGQFVPINCGALPEGLIESELFGHVKGAFSGAVRDKKGRFELATGGTVFLDEVAELPKFLQVKLLRFLQDGRFEKVGGEKTISVDVRVISATNKDLKEEIKKNRFREDLYYRLNVVPIHLPDLHERRNDIPYLVDHFLSKATERYGIKKLNVARETLALMMDYDWPGNVRELQNAVQFAVVKCSDSVIMPGDLPMELTENRKTVPKRGPAPKLDREIVQAALERTGGNKSKAAKTLGVGRATLYRFLNEYPEIFKNLDV